MSTAQELHRQMIVVNGTDTCPIDDDLEKRLKLGGVTCNVTYGPTTIGEAARKHKLLQKYSRSYVFARSVKEIRQAKRQGKIAFLFNWQHCNPIGDDENLLESFKMLGISICGLCYNVRNLIGDGCTERVQGGLSMFGQRVVKKINALRMVLDIGGHTGERTSWDALEISKGPVICSHTNCRALRDNPRCMTDKLMKAIASRNGVIGLTCFGHFVTAGNNSTLDLFLDHVDHAVKVAGVSHVGLGLDQMQYPPPPGFVEVPLPDPYVIPPNAYPPPTFSYTKGLEDPSGIPKITAGLLKRGYNAEEIRKIMGENWLRVYEEVWGS